MSEPTIIRASALSGYPDCPRRAAARLFRREIEAGGYRLRVTLYGIGAAVGTAVHRAAAVTFAEKAASGALPPASLATDCARDTLAEELARGEVAYDGPRGITHNGAQAEHQAIRMTTVYHRVIAPVVDAIRVEERLEAEVAPGLVLSGQPDIIAREPGAIRDLKTGVRQGSHAPQAGAYALLARTHGLDIQSASIDFIQRVAAGKPQPDPVSKPVPLAAAETAATRILAHIEDDLRTFREGDHERRILPGDPWAFVANSSSVLCAEKWCPCWGVTGPHAFCNEWQPKE